jgi:KRAB domain-containing zinc finger protein
MSFFIIIFFFFFFFFLSPPHAVLAATQNGFSTTFKGYPAAEPAQVQQAFNMTSSVDAFDVHFIQGARTPCKAELATLRSKLLKRRSVGNSTAAAHVAVGRSFDEMAVQLDALRRGIIPKPHAKKETGGLLRTTRQREHQQSATKATPMDTSETRDYHQAATDLIRLREQNGQGLEQVGAGGMAVIPRAHGQKTVAPLMDQESHGSDSFDGGDGGVGRTVCSGTSLPGTTPMAVADSALTPPRIQGRFVVSAVEAEETMDCAVKVAAHGLEQLRLQAAESLSPCHSPLFAGSRVHTPLDRDFRKAATELSRMRTVIAAVAEGTPETVAEPVPVPLSPTSSITACSTGSVGVETSTRSVFGESAAQTSLDCDFQVAAVKLGHARQADVHGEGRGEGGGGAVPHPRGGTSPTKPVVSIFDGKRVHTPLDRDFKLAAVELSRMRAAPPSRPPSPVETKPSGRCDDREAQCGGGGTSVTRSGNVSTKLEVARQVDPQATASPSTDTTKSSTIRGKHACKWKGCSKTFTASGSLRTHTRTHTGEKPFACTAEGCSYRAVQSSHLKRHVQTHSGEKPFVCTWKGCQFRTAQSGRIKAHTRTHTGEKPFVCTADGCTYRAGNSSNLKKHTRTHTGEKPFACTWEGCSYRSAYSSDYKVHTRIHTGEKPFVCALEPCQFRCATSSDFKVHERSHTGEKPYVCSSEGCDFRTAKSSHLKQHTRVHTGEKPYVCIWEDCNFSAANSTSLKVHTRRHTGDKPFVCTVDGCQFRSAYSSVLKQHALIHSED